MVCFVQVYILKTISDVTMCDQQPVIIQASKKVKHSQSGDLSQLFCTTHYAHNTGEKLTQHAFHKIHKTAAVWQQQQNPPSRLDDVCANNPIVYIPAIHDHHKKCYKASMNTLYLKHSQGSVDSADSKGSADSFVYFW